MALYYMHQEVYAPAKYNPHAYEFGGAILKRGDSVVDAGACEGFFTRYALECGTRVIAIEPVKLLVDGLEKTFSDEIIENRVIIINTALGSCNGQEFLSVDSAKIYESHLDVTGDRIAVKKLDEIITTKIDFIKMDIEEQKLKH